MNKNQVNDLYKTLVDFTVKHDLTRTEMLSFLSACFVGTLAMADVGTLAMADYDDAFIRATFANMFIQYKNKKAEMRLEDE